MGFGEQGNNGINFRERGLNWRQQGNKGNFGEQGELEMILIWRNRESERFISGEQGNIYHPPPGGLVGCVEA